MPNEWGRPQVKAPSALAQRAGQGLDGDVMDALLHGCIGLDASDLHLTVGQPPVYRRYGVMCEVEGYKLLEHDDLAQAVSFFIGPETSDSAAWRRLTEKGGCDAAYALSDGNRFRVSVYHQKGHLVLALRLIPRTMLTFEQLGLPEAHIRELLQKPRGLILLTGPTGSGKSTTLASMINWINENRGTHIITIEEPIEYYHTAKRSLVNQRQVGIDVDSFAEGVVRNMRSDPDIILIGEMRDLETMRAALQAAETGHLVFSTLHTVSAPKTIDRLVTAFPAAEQEEIRAMTSTSLAAVVSQELIPRVDKDGRIAAYEIMIGEAGGSPAIGNLIRERKTSQMRTTIQSSGAIGMQLLEAHMARLVNDKKIGFEEAYNRSNEKNDFMNFVDNALMPEGFEAMAVKQKV